MRRLQSPQVSNLYPQVNFTVEHQAIIWPIPGTMGRTLFNKGALVPMRRKVERRFYEPLLLLSALGQMRGERTKSEIITDSLCPNIQKLRRNFVDGIAYICSFTKEPKRVTAVAIEKTPQGNIVWLAANENIGKKVVQFLGSVLSDIQQISTPNDKDSRQKEGERMREGLASKIVDFNTPRIGFYYKRVARILKSWKIISEERLHGTTLSLTLDPAVRLHVWIFADSSI